ncbi:NERD domain-containing protein [Streptomyces sp. NPDC060035]|uniref:NERD domain-containing protein n=1 Tax=Streptomyces sp. NPDC060035 TaxID=3347044 RepID=UPI0036CC1034
MQDLKVTSWQLFGHDRLYVNLPDGTAIGWADLGSGTITVLHPRYRDAVTDALARQVPDMPVLGEAVPPGPPPVPRIPPLRQMRRRDAGRAASPDEDPLPTPARDQVPGAATGVPVPDTGRLVAGPEQASAPGADLGPVPDSGPAPGQEQAPVPRSGSRGRPDRNPDRLRVPEQGRVREPAPGPVQQAPGPRPEQEGPRRRPELPALTAANDLAARRPGAGLRAQLAEDGAGLLVRATTGALRRSKEADPRRAALAGERRVGAELRRLTRHGWRVLHSLPLPHGAEIGHLLIGPGGVFAVRSVHRPRASVRIGEDTLQIDEGSPQTYVLEAGAETRRARAVLETHCTFAVPVQSVLVFVGVAALDVLATPPDVRVCQDRHLSALAPLKGVLTPTQVERVYDVARNRDAWPAA